jgi:hypothetical protein
MGRPMRLKHLHLLQKKNCVIHPNGDRHCDSADTGQPPNGQIALILNNPARQKYRYTPLPIAGVYLQYM